MRIAEAGDAVGLQSQLLPAFDHGQARLPDGGQRLAPPSVVAVGRQDDEVAVAGVRLEPDPPEQVDAVLDVPEALLNGDG